MIVKSDFQNDLVGVTLSQHNRSKFEFKRSKQQTECSIRVPTLLVTINSRTPEAFFQHPVISQQCLNTETNIYIQYDSSISTGVYVHHRHMLQRNSKDTVRTLFTIIYNWYSIYTSYCRIFWHLHPHHCLANSRTLHLDFQDQTHFPGLSRSWKLYRRCGNPVYVSVRKRSTSSMLRSHLEMLSNVLALVMSYTSMMPIAPR